jgi:hypothetical protein
MSIQVGSSNPARFHPAHLGESAGLFTLRLKMIR